MVFIEASLHVTMSRKTQRSWNNVPVYTQDEIFSVRVATHSSLFIAACQHDQSLHILLPDHSPEIFDRGRQRTLSCNKLLPGVVTLPNDTTAQHTSTDIQTVYVFREKKSVSNFDMGDGS